MLAPLLMPAVQQPVQTAARKSWRALQTCHNGVPCASASVEAGSLQQEGDELAELEDYAGTDLCLCEHLHGVRVTRRRSTSMHWPNSDALETVAYTIYLSNSLAEKQTQHGMLQLVTLHLSCSRVLS